MAQSTPQPLVPASASASTCCVFWFAGLIMHGSPGTAITISEGVCTDHRNMIRQLEASAKPDLNARWEALASLLAPFMESDVLSTLTQARNELAPPTTLDDGDDDDVELRPQDLTEIAAEIYKGRKNRDRLADVTNLINALDQLSRQLHRPMLQ